MPQLWESVWSCLKTLKTEARDPAVSNNQKNWKHSFWCLWGERFEFVPVLVHGEAFTYMYAMCAESGGQLWIPLLGNHSLFLETRSLTGTRGSWIQLRCPASSPRDSNHAPPREDFPMRTELRSSCFTQQILYKHHYPLGPQNPTLRRFCTAVFTAALWKQWKALLINRKSNGACTCGRVLFILKEVDR